MISKTQLQLLKQLSECSSPSGYEESIKKMIIKEITPYVDEIHIDHIGNLYAIKRSKVREPSLKKVMTAAHMDEIGLIVSHINEEGFIFFSCLGGFDSKTLVCQEVKIHGKEEIIGVIGCKPIHCMKADEKKQLPELHDLYIDTGLSYEELESKVSIGTPITRNKPLKQIGHNITGKSLDNRLCVFILIEVIKNLTNIDYDHYAVFTTQEEVGLRGAKLATQHIKPDIGICLDTTIANDVPDIPKRKHVTSLGKGPAIKILDSGVITNTALTSFILKIADKQNIQIQKEIMTGGSTDTSAMQSQSVTVASLSIPTRYLHSTIETANTRDINDSITLLTHVLKKINQFKVTKLPLNF